MGSPTDFKSKLGSSFFGDVSVVFRSNESTTVRSHGSHPHQTAEPR
jgi:hypothetical protein